MGSRPGRRYGDLVVSAFFAADNDRKRKERLESLADDLVAQRSQYDVARDYRLEATVTATCGAGRGPSSRSTGRSSSPRCSTARIRGSMRSSGNPPFAGSQLIIRRTGGDRLD